MFRSERENLSSFREVPELLIPVMKALDELDRVKYEELILRREYEEEVIRRPKPLTGQWLCRNAIERGFIRPSIRHVDIKGVPVNVIPPIGEPGPCTEILLVFIGKTDNFEVRVLEAIEHSGVLCYRTTKYVIFYALKWDDVVWKRHEQTFKKINVTVFLKPFGRPPTRIL
jgi:hypothetical protein